MQLKPPPAPRGAYNQSELLPTLIACDTYGGHVVGGYSSHTVAMWDITDPSMRHSFTIPVPPNRPRVGAMDPRHQHPHCPEDARDVADPAAADSADVRRHQSSLQYCEGYQLEADALLAQQLATEDAAAEPSAYWAEQGIDGSPPQVTSVAVSPSVVAAGSSAGWLHIWHRATATAVFSYQAEAGLR